MTRNVRLITEIGVVLLLVSCLVQIVIPNGAAAPVTQFSFASAGDYGFNSASRTIWSSMHSSGANFAIGVGDFLYNKPTSTANEQTWCNQSKAQVPNLELVVGNHETWETNSTDGGGSINKFVKYCPFTLGTMSGTYGFRYYFDYPSSAPLARFIMINPAIWSGKTSSSSVSYSSGTANYNWVLTAIDSARSASIPWVVVVMHKICIGTGEQGCEVSQSFMTMLMNKRVDVIIQAHDHTYERSKQLTCATDGTFVSSCVANSGSSFLKGAGTVYVIDGTGGEGGGTTSSNKPDTGYFAKYCCSNGTPLGYSLFTITGSSLESKFVNTGGRSYTDSFTITGGAPPPPPPPTPDFSVAVNPTSLSFSNGSSAKSTITVSSLNGFTGTVSLSASVSPSGLTASLNPTSLTLTSGGSGTSSLTVSSSTAGNYTVTVTGSSGSLAHFSSVTVQVTTSSPPPPPPPPPPSSQYALVTTFSGQIYKLQDGSLSLIGQLVTTALRQIGWKPDGSYALIVGDSAVLLKWDGASLVSIPTTGVMSSGDDLNTVAWRPDGSYALIGGTGGDLLKYDGTTLTKIPDPNTSQIQGISWKPGGTTALLVGNGGALFTYQNGVITILNSGTTNDLYGVAWNPNGQYALISGSNGSILKWDGTSATPLNTSGLYPLTTTVRYLAWNSAGSQALLVGTAGGLVLSYDGTSLAVLSSGTSNGLYSLAWSASTATIVGNGGTMLTYSAGTFKTAASGTTSNFRGCSWKPV